MADGTDQHKYDLFISYSRKDSEFVRRLHRALANYTPPRDLPVPQRHLRVFRDESDLQGTEYNTAIEQNLNGVAKLLVISSPHSRASAYVGGEIRTFASLRGKEHIISLLLSGVPNNQAEAPQAEKAFHDELVMRLSIPLAADYRGYQARDRLERDRYESAWYKLLADIYADYQIDRDRIEQREKVRQRHSRRVRTAVVGVSTVILAALTIWALVSRREAIAQRNTAQSRFLAAQSLSGTQTFEMTLLLAAAAYRTNPTAEAWEALFLSLQRQPSLARYLHGHDGVPAALIVSDNGACVAALMDDRTLVWDLQTGEIRADIPSKDRRPTANALGSKCSTLVRGFEDGAVQFWSLVPSPTLVWSAGGRGKAVSAIATNSRGDTIAVGENGRLVLRASSNGDVVAEVVDVRPTFLKFNSEGTVLASVDRGGAVQRWGAEVLDPLDKPSACRDFTNIFTISDDLTRCASSGVGGPNMLTVTDLTTATAFTWNNNGWVLALDFSHDGRNLLSGNQGGELQLWDLETTRREGEKAKPTKVWSEHRGDITALAHSSHDSTFVSSARDQSIIVWRSSPSDRLVSEVTNEVPEFAEAGLSSSLREAAVADRKGNLFLLNLDKPGHPVSIGSLGRPVTALVFREEEREIFAAGPTGEVTGRMIESGQQWSFNTGHDQRIRKLRVNATGSRLAAAAENGTVTLWNLADGRLLSTFPENNSRKGRSGSGLTDAVDVDFEPAGDDLVSVHGDRKAFRWHWLDSTYRFDPFLFEPSSYFTSVAFSSDRHTVALGTGLYEGVIAVLDSLNPKAAAVFLNAHGQSDVTGLAFSPDGRLLLSGGVDGQVNIWDVAGRRRVGQTYRVPDAEIVAFAKSGLAAVAATGRGAILRWDLNPVHWLAAACRIANRDWTAEERLRLLGRADGEPVCPVRQ